MSEQPLVLIVAFLFTLAACAKNFHTNPIVLYLKLKLKLKVIKTDSRRIAYAISQTLTAVSVSDFFSLALQNIFLEVNGACPSITVENINCFLSCF